MAVCGAAVLVLAGCGGDDDDAADMTTTVVAETTTPPTTAETTTPPTTAAPSTTTTTVLVTQGATVVVANASSINGAAGRMSDVLAGAGFSTDAATNSTEGTIAVSKVYFDPSNPDAEAVANSLKALLGGGAIEVLEMVFPPLIDGGDLGEATILLAMGDDIADRSLAELQAGVGSAAAPVTETTGG